MTRGQAPTDKREASNRRERFLAEGAASGEVRAQIRRPWPRSRRHAVRADGDPATEYTPFDPQARLLRVATPVLIRVAEQVSNIEMAVILTDPHGLVLDRRASHWLLKKLDYVRLAPGYVYSEQTVGTNGIGTAAQDHGSAWVVGSEHYAEWLRDLACAGAVIRNPVSGRVEGVLDLICAVDDTNPLMVPFVNQAAREIERRLYDDAPQADQELISTLLDSTRALQPPDPQFVASRLGAMIRAAEARAAGEERRRLARELHDSVSQALYGITLGIDTARDLLGPAPHEVRKPLDYVRELAVSGLTEVRALMSELRSELLEQEGLVGALSKQMAAIQTHHGVRVQRLLPREPMASPATKEALFRIGQEALHNVVKHAGAKTVQLRLRTQDTDLVLEIVDDGLGFDSQQEPAGHFGLRSMRERALKAGGHFNVWTARGKGTRIRAAIPLHPGSG